jgi:catechol 2,3-dioxygenase-like lactoylglutathione lyase family enzyme
VRVTASAVSLNVDDVDASVRFMTAHFGFTEAMSADGFASLTRPDAALNVVYYAAGWRSCLKTSGTTTRTG